MTKPREWWIEFDREYTCVWLGPPAYPSDEIKPMDVVQVIEKSAYDSLQAKLGIAVEALEIYEKLKVFGHPAAEALAKIKEPEYEDPQEKKYRETGI